MQQVKEYRTVLILAAAVAGAGLMSACASTHTDTVESAPGQWNSHETAAYQRYLTDQHMPYRPYSELSAAEQQEYWNWRAKHPG
jgi:hypothetical protein